MSPRTAAAQRPAPTTVAPPSRGTLASPGAVLQPIAYLADGEVWGYEALCRIPGSPEKLFFRGAGRALPDEILVKAEERMLRRALACRAQLNKGDLLTVNLSPFALLSDEIQHAIADHGPLDGVVVELTEHREPEPIARLLPAIDALREQGAGIALDDVGAGRAGLRYARQIRPDLIKIDRDVVRGIDTEPLQRVMLDTVLRVSSELEIPVVAEGIERREELDVLLTAGIRFGQGYLIGRPAAEPRALGPHVCRYLQRRASALASTR